MKNHNTNKLIFLITIAGPTAVGKTDITLKLAKHFNAEIFSADSRQLYREMSIGTAKPSPIELSEVKHHFIDHISVTEHYNAGSYERDFDDIVASYFKNKEIGILTGGTGLYLNAAIDGLDKFPEVSEDVKLKYATILKEKGITEFQKLLQMADPQYANIVDMDNPRRLSRALEVIDVSGKPYSSFLNVKKEKKQEFIPIKICLTRDREELYNRINCRVDLMINNGQVEEVKSLEEYKELKSLQTVGYSEIFQYLDGSITLDRAIELIKRNSRRYAKRQMTWFKNQGDYTMVAADDYDLVLQTINTAMSKLSEIH